ncbi:hypothetical protein DY000_02037801 [Brassica cretica]|uniref:Uncharacterized protein n=1 Tax=Brassica cretica TaxID=69181 RepID=A0ABQ7BKF3_BRACR|nr:hypothetical protein DY000_02037801 [Brassica cretica]
MAMLYISHADETERLARIERVRQGIAESQEESSARITRITRDLDKGNGHVFSFQEVVEKRPRAAPLQIGNLPRWNEASESDAESGSSAIQAPTFSAPAKVPTGFHLGPSSEGRVTGNLSSSKSQRRRPPSWKRKTSTKPGVDSEELLSGIPSVEPTLTLEEVSESSGSVRINDGCNTIAQNIAESALQVQWQQSYLARNGPDWLDARINMEASVVV